MKKQRICNRIKRNPLALTRSLKVSKNFASRNMQICFSFRFSLSGLNDNSNWVKSAIMGFLSDKIEDSAISSNSLQLLVLVFAKEV